MNLDFKAGSTPLLSRQNPIIYVFLISALIVILFAVAIWIIFMLNKKRKESPEYIEKEKQRITNSSDVKKLAEKFNLTQNDSTLLLYLCRKYKIRNILYSIKEFNELDSIFKQAYEDFKISGDIVRMNRLFFLKFSLDKIFASSNLISSSKQLLPETKLSLLFKSGTKVPCELIENAKDFISINIPESLLSMEDKPNELDKIAFSFITPQGLPYAFVTRLIRYQKINEQNVMIVSHSNELITKTQRNYKRKFVSEKCRFASVKVTTDKKEEFIISDKKIDTKVTNISGGGCCISSALPIKEGQIIYIEFDFKDGTDSVIGKIIKTRKTNIEGVYNLHIKFVRISTETQNKILAKVYSYD